MESSSENLTLSDLPAVVSVCDGDIQVLEDVGRVPACARGGSPSRHGRGDVLLAVPLVVLLVIVVRQADRAHGVVNHHVPGKFDHCNVVLERFGLAVVLMEDDLVDVNILVVTTESVVSVTLALPVQVVLPQPDGGGLVAPGQLGDTVGRSQDPPGPDENPPALVLSPPSLAVAQVDQPGELAQLGVLAAHDTLRKGSGHF